ncbi:MAG: HPr kinase/phosphatase C-terminal domain-containing protein [Alphaproteobacteria bacterium]|nr:HPr kinase/phosphatase C-terminal domain-containing protein [Alphaproteobacteria bacterium]
MMTRDNIYATCVAIGDMGVLISGKSGSGKSDLALRLINNKNAVLVSDDRTDIIVKNNKLYASSPDIIKGMLEVRGVGIVKLPYVESAEIKLVINLVDDIGKIERLPEEKFYEKYGIKIPMADLYAFEVSSVDKVVIKLNHNLEK